MIVVKYFASLKERLGKAEDSFETTTLATVKDVWKKATGDLPQGDILCAINQEYASLDAQVHDGDEVAFFPSVTGG